MSTPHRLNRRDFLGRLSLGTAATLLAPHLRAQSSAPASRKLGVALVGLGRYSNGQLGPSLRETKRCHLAGVVTGSREKGEKWASDFGFPTKNIYHYDTMAQMADNPDIDIVYVVTPNGLHAQHAIAAAKAGKHVIIEKPMANTVAECDAVLAACRAAKVKHAVGYRLHYDPYHKELKRLGREKEFGPLLKMKGDRGFIMGAKAWRADKKLAGGGPLMDLGVYIIQGACMASGEVAPIAATAREIPKTRPEIFSDVEEGLHFTLEFPDGAVCEAFTSYAHRADTFRAEGEKGYIDFKEKAFTYRGAVVETSKGPMKFEPFYQQAVQMDDFADTIVTGRESMVSGEMGRRDLVIIEAIYEAARTGKRAAVKV